MGVGLSLSVVELPSALAGDDNEISADAEGAQRVVMLIAGTAVGAVIIATGQYLFSRMKEVATGMNSNGFEDFY